jgi:ferrous iron transport protein B
MNQEQMLRIALAGNPNSGKTTLFNALTGSNQFVGNWPGVTVEKKEGKLKKRDDVIVTDLPGIYSLSPYTMEEVVARNYLVNERPDAILNIVDGTNLERNLYLTTQLIELGIPCVVAINMMDVVRKNGDTIDIARLSQKLGCAVVEISALKLTGIQEAAQAAIEAAQKKTLAPNPYFAGCVEHALAHIEEAVIHDMTPDRQRWYAVKLFERDAHVQQQLKLDQTVLSHIEEDISKVEAELDDDAESIITNERYLYVERVLKGCYRKKNAGKDTVSDRIDRVVTSRVFGLPIFALIMFLIYFISMVSVGAIATDWVNDGVFGDGWHLFGSGTAAYEEAQARYGDSDEIIGAFADAYGTDAIRDALDQTSQNYHAQGAREALEALLKLTPKDAVVSYQRINEETLEKTTVDNIKYAHLQVAVGEYLSVNAYKTHYGAPQTQNYGIFVQGVPVLLERALDKANAPLWLSGLILNGIVAGVGAVLGFVPQIFVLFLLLAFLEACGYMARIAFVLDRLFRKFGLSGKSFIPMLVGTGCSVPGIMASRTIESERDRRMTVMTTSFIPCSAKMPFIAMIAGAIFGGSAWVATSSYFIGMAAVVVSGLLLKKTRIFKGDAAPFVMELPSYHLPTVKNLLRSMWERGWAFVKKAGTIILLSTVVIWFFTYFGVVNGSFRLLSETELDHSILAKIGAIFSWIFIPLGFGNWQSTVASLTGLVAKENIVGSLGIVFSSQGDLYTTLSQVFTGVSGYAFMAFNLLCAPCFAAMGAIRREMNSGAWTAFAIGYQCVFAYAVALMINQFGRLFTGKIQVIGLIFACLVLAGMIFLLVRPEKKQGELR